jgi:hypothetical protein
LLFFRGSLTAFAFYNRVRLLSNGYARPVVGWRWSAFLEEIPQILSIYAKKDLQLEQLHRSRQLQLSRRCLNKGQIVA